MPTPPPQRAKPRPIGSTRSLGHTSQIASRPLEADATAHRQRWTFFEVARHIMSHGLKPLRSAGRTPLIHRPERGHPKATESKHSPKYSIGVKNHLWSPTSRSEEPQMSAQSTERLIVKGDETPQKGIFTVTGASTVYPKSSTASPSGSTMDGLALRLHRSDVDSISHREGGIGSTSASVFDLPRGLSDSSGPPTPKEMNNQPSNSCQVMHSITSFNQSTGKISQGSSYINPINSKVPPVVSEIDATNEAPISRGMTASEVVSHLVNHGIADLTTQLDYSTFEEHPIVTGGSSDVYRGKLIDGSEVAVKVLRFSAQYWSETSENIQDAARELHTWSKCSHLNVLSLYGLVTFRSRIGMVSPWMSGGTMSRYLKTNPKADRCNLCVQICEGLSYLHKNGIIHGDLKGANVLISEHGAPVLTDFGSSTLRDRTLKFTQAPGEDAFTVRWSAPEFIKDRGANLRTKASDIYALGMTIYEAIVGKVPYYGESEVQVIILVAMKKILPERPGWMPSGNEIWDKLWDLLSRCWSWEPEARPTAIDVTKTMRDIMTERFFVQLPNPHIQSQ